MKHILLTIYRDVATCQIRTEIRRALPLSLTLPAVSVLARIASRSARGRCLHADEPNVAAVASFLALAVSQNDVTGDEIMRV